jgi:hypothetical protein
VYTSYLHSAQETGYISLLEQKSTSEAYSHSPSQEIPALYGTRIPVTVYITARHRSLH